MKYVKSPITGKLFLALALLFISGLSIAQKSPQKTSESLLNFSRLIGGEWHLDDSYQTFEWGVGKMSVQTKNYYLIDGKSKLVSEGYWFLHPGSGNLKGYFTAIDMPFTFFEYTTKFEGNKMTNEMTAYTSAGKSESYTETWEFKEEDTFLWTLYTIADSKSSIIMEGIYKRK